MPTVLPPSHAQAPTPGAPSLALLEPAIHRRASRLARVLGGRAWIATTLVLDALVLAAAAVVTLAVANAPTGTFPYIALLTLLTVAELARRRLYRSRPGRMGLLDTSRETLSSVIFATLVTLAGCAIADDPAAADAVLRCAGALAVALPGARLLLAVGRRRAHAGGLLGTRTLIIGAGAIGAQLEQRLAHHPEIGLTAIGYLDADPPADAGRSIPVLGSPDELERVVAVSRVEYAIFAFSSAPDSEVLPLMRRCERLGLEVAVVPRLFENVNARQRIEHVGGLPLLAMHTPHPNSWQYGSKHLIDRVVAGMLLVATAPIIALAAIAVKLSSPGPAFFNQRRVGRDGQAFDLVKLRSMRSSEDSRDEMLKRRLRATGSAPGGIEGSDRRTRVGALLRRTSIDELPQLLNVMRGHMSLVGPRPERPEFVQLFESDMQRYGDRHRVRSGMTGWAQVHGLRGQTSLADRVEWDNWYIQNWSLWLDFKILLLTPLEILRSGAESHPAPRSDAAAR